MKKIVVTFGGESLLQALIGTPARRGGFVVTSGGESLIIDLISTARRRGVPFTRVKGTKTRLGLCPKTPVACSAGYERHFSAKKPSVLHADGLKKSLRRIFIAAALERRTANHHPCPLLGGGELWGRKTNTF